MKCFRTFSSWVLQWSPYNMYKGISPSFGDFIRFRRLTRLSYCSCKQTKPPVWTVCQFGSCCVITSLLRSLILFCDVTQRSPQRKGSSTAHIHWNHIPFSDWANHSYSSIFGNCIMISALDYHKYTGLLFVFNKATAFDMRARISGELKEWKDVDTITLFDIFYLLQNQVFLYAQRHLHRVFETRTATGSEPFSLLTCFHSTTFILLGIFSPLEMISIKIKETPSS